MTPQLTRSLVLEARQATADGAGGVVETWLPLGALWADVRARTGREVSRAAAAFSRAGYRITVRAAPVGSPSRPMPDQRFREDTRVFRIEAVAEADAKGRYLTCFAHEEVGG
jgi:SPP1 family predicted phage head-tail adaptor